MIPKECKRLAEVDFPVAEVSRHSAREKSIRHGHPSTLHLWWAQRPLAACRAMLMALLLPDPCDVNCPGEFREEARQLLKLMPNCEATGSNKELRDALLKFIANPAARKHAAAQGLSMPAGTNKGARHPGLGQGGIRAFCGFFNRGADQRRR
ncbi:MAG: DUF1156 domain-containing protein [Acidobacteriota bacterium]|jgi:adenine-specific DNA methylase